MPALVKDAKVGVFAELLARKLPFHLHLEQFIPRRDVGILYKPADFLTENRLVFELSPAACRCIHTTKRLCNRYWLR